MNSCARSSTSGSRATRRGSRSRRSRRRRARPAGLEHSLCILRKTCGDIPVVEHTGDVYSCDHFVDERHRVGNLRESRLVQSSRQARAASLRPRQARRTSPAVPRMRRARPVSRRVPEGPVRADRGRGGWAQLPVPGVQAILPTRCAVRSAGRGRAPHADARGSRAGRFAWRRTRHSPASPAHGRNDPCPCGSGKKFKQCCLRDGTRE